MGQQTSTMSPYQGGLVGTGSKGYTKRREPCLAGTLVNPTPRDRQGTPSTRSITEMSRVLLVLCATEDTTSWSFARQTISQEYLLDGIGPWVGNRARETPNRSSSAIVTLPETSGCPLSQIRPLPLDVALGAYPAPAISQLTSFTMGALERVIVTSFIKAYLINSLQ